jgi:hypothetical protein
MKININNKFKLKKINNLYIKQNYIKFKNNLNNNIITLLKKYIYNIINNNFNIKYYYNILH